MEITDNMDTSHTAESSKAGAKRMRQLMTPAKLGSPSTSSIHPGTGHLIYPSTSSAFAGHLLTPLFSGRAPRPLPTPPILTPGREISISPSGEWVVIFHPNPHIPNQVGEGGTLAIYPSSILSPISKPTTRTTVPLATFPLPSDVLAVHHLYPPRLHLPPPHNRAKARGPAPPPGYKPSQGPGLVILTSTSLILLHPQSAGPGQPGSPPQYMMGMLTCPLNTRWHAAPGGSMPPETGWKVDEGWIGLVGDDDGVWVGWRRKGDVGVIRAELGTKDGRPYFRTTPMPSLPIHSTQMPHTANDIDSEIATQKTIQGITFFSVPHRDPAPPSAEGEDIAISEAVIESPKRNLVGASIQVFETELGKTGLSRTTIEVVGFEKREVELVEGFSEMGSSGETETGARSWDWFTLPQLLQTSSSGPDTALRALIPLPDLPPYTLSLAIVQSGTGLNLVHLGLCSSARTNTLEIRGEGVSLDPDLSPHGLELVPSQAVQRGLRGLVAVISREDGASLVLMPTLPAEAGLVSNGVQKKGGDVEDTAMGIVLAMRQGVSYADVVRVAFAATGKDDLKDIALDVLRKVYDLLEADLLLDEGPQLHRLQVALFSHVRDDRRSIAAELVKLYEASHLFNTTAYTSPTGSIAFDLDTVWSLISVAEWVMVVLSNLFRSVVLYKGSAAWSTASPPSDNPTWSRLSYLLHPQLRGLLLRLLSQIQAFKGFLETLEEPIMQPASRYMPVGRRRDPRATVLARERGRDLGVRDGVGIDTWGRALQDIHNKSETSESSESYTMAFLSIDPTPLFALPAVQTLLNALPSPSSLLLTDSADPQEVYDGITFEPLQLGTGVVIRCDRCSWPTKSLGFDLDLGGGNGVPGVGGERVGEGWSGYVRWRKEREEGCGCGGTWVRESVGAAGG